MLKLNGVSRTEQQDLLETDHEVITQYVVAKRILTYMKWVYETSRLVSHNPAR